MSETREQRMDRRNGPLLRKVGDVIAAEPERYEQAFYFGVTECGTTACLAGHAAMLSPDAMCDRENYVVTVGGKPTSVGNAAQLVLGLDFYERGRLFSPGWTPAGDGPLHERVQAALYALADGATVEEVTAPE